VEGLLAAAFPGYEVVPGRVASAAFGALADGAFQLFARDRPVDAVYRGCASWAVGRHAMLGVGVRTDPAWGSSPGDGRLAPLVTASDPTSQPRTWCRHDPLSCDCLGRDVSTKALMIGLCTTDIPTVLQVADWARRWGRVYAVVPNPTFRAFASRALGGQRVFSLAVDAPGVTLPSSGWFGAGSAAAVGSFWSASYLRWTKVPLGAAFHAVEFEVTKKPPGGASVLVGAFAGQGFGIALQEAVVAGAAGIGYAVGDTVVRSHVVNEAELSAAGRDLDSATWGAVHRAAARAAREPGAEFPPGEEAQVGASLAWARLRQQRLHWMPWLWVQELLFPAAPTPGSVSGRSRALVVALVLALWGFRRWAGSGGPLATAFRTAMAGRWIGGMTRVFGEDGAELTRSAIVPRGPVLDPDWIAFVRALASLTHGLATWVGVPYVAAYAVTVAPLWEEAFKRLHPALPLLVGLFEVWERWYIGGREMAARQAPVVFMHLYCGALPYWAAVRTHAGTNAVLMLLQHWDPLRTRWAALRDGATWIGDWPSG